MVDRTMQSHIPAAAPQKLARAGRCIHRPAIRLSWRLTGSAGQAQRPEQKSAVAGRWLACLLALSLACLPGLAGAAINCTLNPEKCCSGYSPSDIRVCSGHGTCSPPNCTCTVVGWTGANCEVEKECGTSGAPYFCNGHGKCSTDVCLCASDMGYTGKACEIPLSPRLQPAAVDFGSHGLGEAAPVATLVLGNWVETRIDSIAVSGAAAADFTLGGDCAVGASLALQAGCSVTVGFAPTAPGARGATLSIVVTATLTSTTTTLTAALAGSGGLGIEDILIDPVASGRLYAGLDGAGVYVSADGGANWTAAAAQPGNRRVKALAKQGGTPLYAGTYGGGVYQAADGGTAFAACAAQPANLNVLSLAIDANGKLYAGTEAGTYVSADACAHWMAINGGLP